MRRELKRFEERLRKTIIFLNGPFGIFIVPGYVDRITHAVERTYRWHPWRSVHRIYGKKKHDNRHSVPIHWM